MNNARFKAVETNVKEFNSHRSADVHYDLVDDKGNTIVSGIMPTKEQLASIDWWTNHTPHGTTHYIELDGRGFFAILTDSSEYQRWDIGDGIGWYTTKRSYEGGDITVKPAMKPTQQQLNDPKWWDLNAPEGATHYAKDNRHDCYDWMKKDGDDWYYFDENRSVWIFANQSYSGWDFLSSVERPTARDYQPDWSQAPSDATHYHLDGCEWWLCNDMDDWYAWCNDTWMPEDKPNPRKIVARPASTTQSVTAADTVKAALKHMQDRAATYDKPTGERSMASTVEAFNAISGHRLTEEQGWMFMALLKIVRSQQGDFKLDNYEDLAAYSGLMAEAGSAERQNE